MQSDLYDLIEDILQDWAIAVSNGQPNPKSHSHLLQLEAILVERKYNRDAIRELIARMMEADCKVGQNPKRDNCTSASGQTGGGKKDKEDKKSSKKKETDKEDKKDKEDKSTEETATDEVSNNNKADIKKRYERGHKKGAPGNPGSMLNEEGSNDVAEQMIKNPDMTEEEALDYLLKNIEGTELETQNQSKTIAGDLRVGDLPKDTPVERRGVVSKAILAVRNARRKAQKARQHIDKHGWDEKNCKNLNFGGEAADKKKQIEFLKDKKVYAFKNGKRVQIPPEKVEDFINSAGKKKNPSDTSSIIYNEKTGETTILFHSDKDSPVAQTGNSTQMEELTGEVTKENLNQLVEEEIITQDQADEILEKRRQYAERINEIEDEFKARATAASKESLNQLDNGDIDAKDVIDNFKKLSTSDDPEVYWNNRVVKQYDLDACNERKSDGSLTKGAVNARKFLKDANPDSDSFDTDEDLTEAPTEEQMLRAYFKKNSETPPTGKDKAAIGRLNKGEDTKKRQGKGLVVKGFNFTEDSAVEIEKIRTRALEMELQQKLDLNETKIDIDGTDIGMGDYLAASNIWEMSHMDMLTQKEGTVHEYDDMFEVNMSGSHLNKEILERMGIRNKNDFYKRVYVADELIAQEDNKGNITGAGKIVYIMKGDERSEMDDIEFQIKKIRTKQGPEAKASTVYNNGKGLIDIIREKGKTA